MRQLGTINSQPKAQRFAAYLTTQGISAHTEQETDGWTIWVRDEDHLAEALEAFEQFRYNPDDPRYQGIERKAESLRRQEEQKREQARQKMVDMPKKWSQPGSGKKPLVMTLIGLSVLVSLFGSFGDAPPDGAGRTMLNQLSFVVEADYRQAQGDPLVNVKQGELWRLVTPIFVHLSVLHLVFNMLWLFILGGQIEQFRGTWRLGLLVLVAAVFSNTAQAVFPVEYQGTPFFGGMSGVVYALFGYVWMKSHFEPTSGMHLETSTIVILLAWFFLCWTGAVGNIANIAHTGGLLAGMAIGYSPIVWRSLTGR